MSGATWASAVGWDCAVVFLASLVLALSFRLWLAVPRPAARRHSIALAGIAALLALFLGCAGWLHLVSKQPPMRPAATNAANASSFPSAQAAVTTVERASFAQAPRLSLGVGEAVKVVGLAWALVAGLLLLRVVGGLVVARGLSRRARRVDSGAVRDAFEALRRRLRVVGPVDLLVSPDVDAPVAFGWRRARVIVPEALLPALSSGTATALLGHELAHVQRRDFAVALLQALSEALLFHCPGVRFLASEAKAAREEACDDIAAQAEGLAPYASALGLLGVASRSACAPAIGAAGPLLSSRIRRLLEGEPMRKLTTSRRLGMVAGVIVALGATWSTATIAKAYMPSMATPARPIIPIVYGASQPGAPVRIAGAPQGSSAFVFDVVPIRNAAEWHVRTIRFAAWVEVPGQRTQPVLLTGQPLTVDLAPGARAAVRVGLLSAGEVATLRARLGGNVQATLAIMEVVPDDGGPLWRVTPRPNARTFNNAFYIPAPTVLPAMVGSAPVSSQYCLDAQGRGYSRGAIVGLDEVAFVRCCAGQWQQAAWSEIAKSRCPDAPSAH
jgi:beta-lactamase regulating signal transducer with metallopeptidase domain